MRDKKWLVLFTAALVGSSLLFYGLHYAIFRDFDHILIYGLGDLAFLPIEVLIVSMVIDKLLEANEKRAMLNKMNMVIGAFFSEAGTGFMSRVFAYDRNFEKVRGNFIVTGDWTDKTFIAVKNSASAYDYRIHAEAGDLPELKEYLLGKREFLLRLLENPNLLEHELFSELLWSVFHLTEELAARRDLTNLSKADEDHISLDIKRAYVAVLAEWLDYMRHLKKSYPYLYAMAVRTNPFDPDAQAEIA